MSDIHVLTNNGKGYVSVILHIPIPDETNSDNVSSRTALINSRIGGNTSLIEGVGPGHISTAEKAKIESGELHEYRTTFPLESAGTDSAQQRVALRALYASRKIQVLAGLQREVRYFGHTEDEA